MVGIVEGDVGLERVLLIDAAMGMRFEGPLKKLAHLSCEGRKEPPHPFIEEAVIEGRRDTRGSA